MKKYLLISAAALALASCSSDDFLGGVFSSQKGNGEISFGVNTPNMTRAAVSGKDAADKLGGKFTVYGWKTNTAASGETAGAHEDVYQDYLVTWAVNTANTTESNTADWEYVNNTSQPIVGEGVNQTIKYWDYSTYRYDFIAWTIAGGNAVLTARPQVSSTSVEPSLTFNASTASDLGHVYISDKYTATPDGAVPTKDNDGSTAVLTNANHGKNTLGQYKDQAVKFQFRTLAAKARIGIYETVPGYKVSDVVFYEQAATNAHDYTYSVATGDYQCDQSYGTLYASSNIFTQTGDVTVKYHDKTYNNTDEKLDNTAYTEVTNATKSSFFAFGKLTNTKGNGAKTAVVADEVIGTTSSTATMSIGNDENTLYTYVFPMETNDQPLNLKVNYKLTSIDGSGETILVTGANAQIPANYAKWMANYAYTYLFKISDNTNGNTGGTGASNPEGLYPITFDACVVDAVEGNQETITTVHDYSITTYQDGSAVTSDNEYKNGKDIYVAVEGYDVTSSNMKLFIAEDKSAIENLTEETAANYMNNPMIFTNVTSLMTFYDAATTVPNSSGAGHAINFAADRVASFMPANNTVYVVEYTTGGTPAKSYKVIKVGDANATQTYAVAMTSGQSKATGEAATFTIKNGTYNVTGAKSEVVVKKGATVVTTQFEIDETSEGNFTVTPKTAVAGTDYKVSFNGVDADNTFTVTAPVWNDGTNDITSIIVEEGHAVTVKLLNKTGGSAIVGVTPTVPAGITATATNASGETTLTAATGASGDKSVSYNGSILTVKVDNFSLSLSRSIINVGDTDHDDATLTLTNAGSGTTVNAQTIASSTPAVAAGGSLTSGTMTVTALTKGTTTFSFQNAKANLEVVNYVLADATGGYITLTKDGNALSGATFQTSGTATGVTATSTTGKYKVNGTSGSATISFKYKGEVVADVTITLP